MVRDGQLGAADGARGDGDVLIYTTINKGTFKYEWKGLQPAWPTQQMDLSTCFSMLHCVSDP